MDYDRAWSHLNAHLRTMTDSAGGLSEAFAELEAHQRDIGFIKDDLKSVERFVFRNPDDPAVTFRVQYNPKRALRFGGHGVQTPPDDVENVNDGCFLCRENIRWQQQNAQVGFEINVTGDAYNAWMNPFPLLSNHVVIAAAKHIGQAWDMAGDGSEVVTLTRLLGDLCDIAERLPGHVGFYNGVDAGASIPSHLHFQFFKRPAKHPVFPLEQHHFTQPRPDGVPQFATDYPVPVALWRGDVAGVVEDATRWVGDWARRNRHRIEHLSCNFIAAGQLLDGGVTLYFIPRERGQARWSDPAGSVGSLVGGLEVLGEFVFSSERERAMLDSGEIDFAFLNAALAGVATPFFED